MTGKQAGTSGAGLKAIVAELATTLDQVVAHLQLDIDRILRNIADGVLDGRRLLICGNGGSAADAQHLAGELVSSFRIGLARPAIDALALTVNSSVITAYVNDFDPRDMLARQVEAHGRAGDFLLCISTSGRSPKVVRAAEAGVRGGLTVVGLTGHGGGVLGNLTQDCIAVPSHDTQIIQTVHLVIEHYLCEMVERTFEARSVEQ